MSLNEALEQILSLACYRYDTSYYVNIIDIPFFYLLLYNFTDIPTVREIFKKK